ncbi:MAG: MFS transporter [Sulfuriflexus sp.]|nr:MFS transporter [Sulfuriflexus sp.]
MFKFRVPIKISMMALAIFAILAATVFISSFSLSYMERTLAPEMHKKTVTIGESLHDVVTKIVGYGARFESLNGMDDFLAELNNEYADLSYITITDSYHAPLYKAGSTQNISQSEYKDLTSQDTTTILINGFYNTSLIINNMDGGVLGYIHIGQAKGLIQSRLQDSLLDIITVIVVSILFSLELLYFLMVFTISTPVASLKKLLKNASDGDFSHAVEIESSDEIGLFTRYINNALFKLNDSYYLLTERINKLKFSLGEKKVSAAIGGYIDTASRINLFTPPECMDKVSAELTMYIRPALFLLIFSESLSLSFFPIFVYDLYEPIYGLSREMVVGLPISIFMLIWALSLPSAGSWSDRVGRRKSFIIGALITTVGLVLTGLSQSIYDLLLWRSITAVGYGIVFITCQGYITDHTNLENRTRGMAMFLAGFFSGSLCGAAIGGILVGHIGYNSTFILSGVLSLAAAAFVARFIHEAKDEDKPDNIRKATFSDYIKVLSNSRFITLTLFSAVPAKIALTGFLYYTVPLYMSTLGTEQSSIGRIMMAYGIAMILLSPLVGKLADKTKRYTLLIIIGGVLSTLSLMILYFENSIVGVLMSMTLLGIAHAIGVPPQISLITEISKRDTSEVGVGTAIGVFRLVERIGNVSGPIISGILITVYGYPGAFVGIAAITFTGIVVFSLLFAFFNFRDRQLPDLIEEPAE